MSRPKKLRSFAARLLSVIFAVLISPWISSSHACQICIPLPKATLADRLLESDTVVMAREDPDRPFHYATVEILKGDPGQENIDTFMNSQARSALAINPTYTMVLARAPTDRKWNALGVSRNDSFETTIRKILKRESWTRLNSTNPDRIREFAKLLGHPDRRLHELAYLEVGRAPYSLIKEVSPLISIETMRATLDNFQYAEWHSLAILILGQSDSEIDRGRVLSQLDMSHRHGFSRNLAAWASALIEMDGVNGLHRLQSLFIEDGKASEEQINQLILALSTHGNANADLRDPIADAYGRLIRSNPETAPRFVLDLIAWERWEFVDQYRKYKQGMDPDDPLGNYTINLYLSTASRMNFGALN